MTQYYTFHRPYLLLAGFLCAFLQGYTQSNNRDYILTRTFTHEQGTTSREQIQYFDGLGNPVLIVGKNASPTGADILTLQEYDNLNREREAWNPISINRMGGYVEFNQLRKAAEAFYTDSKPYSKFVYEDSPLNRLVEQYGAGNEWHAQGRSIKTAYLFNLVEDDTLSCRHYSLDRMAGDTLFTIRREKDYDSYLLFVTHTLDEDGNATLTFKDKLGRIVLVRRLLKTDGKPLEMVDTYYLYDNWDNVAAVLPPGVSKSLQASAASTWSSDTEPALRHYAYLYAYDSRNRCNAKKLPGCDWWLQVYDKGDRLILSQDGNQRKRGEWTFQIPDAFGRTCLTGTCTNQVDYAEEPLVETWVKAIPCATTNETKGYALSGISLEGVLIFTVNYYDDYTFMGKNGIPDSTDMRVDYEPTASAEGYGTLYLPGAKGLQTGTLTAQLLPDGTIKEYLYGVMYYDQRGRLIQTRTSNHLPGGTETVCFAYDFIGQLLKRKHIHQATGKEIQTEVYAYMYDGAGRLLQTSHQWNGRPAVLLSSNRYDEVGRLQSVKLHNQASLQTAYTYNVRSYPIRIQSTLFRQRLFYNEARKEGKAVPRYNGGIAAMEWKAGDKLQGYEFTYDGLSRLLRADYRESGTDSDQYSTAYSYDVMGNLLSLRRRGQTGAATFGWIDDLSLTYRGNQLQTVTDASATPVYDNGFEFKDGADQPTEYAYDANGNLVKDLNKRIRGVQYNALNLPCRITFENGNHIDYLYAADGAKLRTTHIIDGITTETDYCGNIIYTNGTPSLLLTEAGYFSFADQQYHYYLKDHQGNNRVVATQTGAVEEVNHYYPFGGTFASSSASVQSYKYNGKELDCQAGLEWYDYGARMYDAVIGRWHVMDPVAHERCASSPYAYASNDPIDRIDPDGKLDDWYKTQTGSIMYDPNVRSQADLRSGEIYLGALFKTNSGILYRSDGSILFPLKYETIAYQRMVSLSINTGNETFSALTAEGILMLPDYNNDPYTVDLESYNYEINELGNIVDSWGKSYKTFGTVHTHPSGTGPSIAHTNPFNISETGDEGFARKTLNKPVFVLQMGTSQEVSFIYATGRADAITRVFFSSHFSKRIENSLELVLKGRISLIDYAKTMKYSK